MSYINEALRKAQKEREARYVQYGGILAAGGKKRRFSARKTLWRALLFLMLILFAFISYSWLDSREIETPVTPELRHEEPEAVLQPEGLNNAKAFYERARAFHRSGRLKDARRLYQETLRIDPGYVDALNNLGVIYLLEKDFPAARNSFEKAIRLNPGYAEPYYNLACLHAVRDEIRQGLVNLKKAVSLDHKVRDWARRDTDLENLRGVREFEEILKGGG